MDNDLNRWQEKADSYLRLFKLDISTTLSSEELHELQVHFRDIFVFVCALDAVCDAPCKYASDQLLGTIGAVSRTRVWLRDVLARSLLVDERVWRLTVGATITAMHQRHLGLNASIFDNWRMSSFVLLPCAVLISKKERFHATVGRDFWLEFAKWRRLIRLCFGAKQICDDVFDMAEDFRQGVSTPFVRRIQDKVGRSAFVPGLIDLIRHDCNVAARLMNGAIMHCGRVGAPAWMDACHHWLSDLRKTGLIDC